MASKHRLRRSCAFCRARKIKCSNEAICEACRRQGADCIYDFEPARPKTRNSQDGTDSGLEVSPSRGRPSLSGSSSENTLVEDLASMLPDDIDNVASALEQTFYDYFSPQRCSSQGRRSLAYQRASQSSSSGDSDGGVGPNTLSNHFDVKYTNLLSLLTHDLIGIASDQFGSLGCHHVENGGARFFLSGLANDETPTMFDDTSLSSNPVSDYGQRQQTQLIDVWFSTHPLSFIVSKTLLLRELRDGTHDEILLATILAEANFSIGDEVAIARGRVLLRWAAAQLCTRPFGGAQLAQNGTMSSDSSRTFSGISTRIFNGSSTAQALMLLGWNALCATQMRRATCYIGLAGRIVADLKSQITTTADPKASSRINGIDVFEVEKELIDQLYWTAYSISLWSFIQTGNRDFAPPMPAAQPSIFVPVTEATSAVIQLDLVSENFNTLQKQKSAIRETWPLAHIASVVAYICTFYPADAEGSLWPGGLPLAQQQRLQHPQQLSADATVVCREISRVLVDGIHHLVKQGAEMSSRSLVLASYHTLVIHFLFPALSATSNEDTFTTEVLERFCSSAQEILRLFTIVADLPQDPPGHTPSVRSSLSNVFSLALDTCSRAFSFIQARRRTDGSVNPAHMRVLANLAGRLYATSKDDFLSQDSTLRMARKQLRSFMQATGGGPKHASIPTSAPVRSSTSHSSPLQRSTSSMSPTDSDHLSTASTAAFDAGSSHFISPKDTATGNIVTMAPPMATLSDTTTGLAAPFSPGGPDMFKPDWQMAAPDELFHATATLNPSALGVIPPVAPGANDNLCAADLVDLQQGAWYPQIATMMDFDMAGSTVPPTMQLDWADMNPDTAAMPAGGSWPDMDTVL